MHKLMSNSFYSESPNIEKIVSERNYILQQQIMTKNP